MITLRSKLNLIIPGFVVLTVASAGTYFNFVTDSRIKKEGDEKKKEEKKEDEKEDEEEEPPAPKEEFAKK